MTIPKITGTAIVAFIGCTVLAITPVAEADVFDVNSVADLGDSNPGDGVCSAFSVYCTLRAATEEANALGGSHTINVPAGTYTLTLGELALLVNADLVGAGDQLTVIHGNYASRVLLVDSNAVVKVSDLTIRDGALNGADGAGISITEGCTVSLKRVIVHSNDCGDSCDGGGIFNRGTLTISDSTVSDNDATGSKGGGISSWGPLTATGVVITGNTAHSAGGMGTWGSVTANKVVVTGNTAIIGGGVYFYGGPVELTDATLNGNTGIGDVELAGGGILILSVTDASFERVTIEGCTTLQLPR